MLREFQNDQHCGLDARRRRRLLFRSTDLTCEVTQVPPNTPATLNKENGWCYVENNGDPSEVPRRRSSSCKHRPRGADVIMSLQCLE